MKMKTSKKVISILMAITLCSGCASAAFAEEDDDYDPDFELMVDEIEEDSEVPKEDDAADGEDMSDYESDQEYSENEEQTSQNEEETESDEDAFENAVPDMTGIWRTDENDGMWMEAEITDSSITIELISNDEEQRSIYWQGSFEVQENSSYEIVFTSEFDESDIQNSIVASDDTEKKLLYNNGLLSVSFDVFGETTEEIFYHEEDLNDMEAMYSSLWKQYIQLLEQYNALVNQDVQTEPIEEENEISTEQSNALKYAEVYLESLNCSYDELIVLLVYSGCTEEDATYAADHCGADWKQNALAEAKEYLDEYIYSYSQLVKNLESEGYTAEEAAYAADNCEADWYDEVVRGAVSCLKDNKELSRSDLISELEYYGFTEDEAVYGADNCGVDWNENDAEDITGGKQNALSKAESYLNTLAYSYSGLIEQLEYSGFSEEEAVYAADNCNADWNEQALKKAKSYLKSMPYSYNSLVDQLEYNGFTTEQATYAADSCGADWNEQAVKKAESYLSIMSYSRDKLIGQLEYNGFTTEQAEYAANAVGL